MWGRLDLRMLWTVACVRQCPGAVDAQARRASVHVLAASRCSGREACAVLASRVRLCRGWQAHVVPSTRALPVAFSSPRARDAQSSGGAANAVG